MTPWQSGLVAAALLVAALAALLAWASVRLRAGAGLPRGRVVYSDTRRWERGEVLRSARHGLVGRPDYLVRRGALWLPVEVKPSRRAAEPYEADALQLAAYCLLVQDHFGQRPPYGLLRYAETTFRLPYTRRAEARLLRTMAAMRRDRERRDVPRSHSEQVRCRRCGLRRCCGSAL